MRIVKTHTSLRICSLCMLFVLFFGTKSFANCNVPISVNTSGTITSFPASGGSSTYMVTTGGSGGIGCTFTTAAGLFISTSPTSGGGIPNVFSFSINFTVASNPDLTTRSGLVESTQSDGTRADFAVTQAAAGGGFTISAVSPGSQTVQSGGSTTYTVTISRTGGFIGRVHLTAIGLPKGANGSFNPDFTTGNTSTLTVTTAANTTAAGSYTFTVRGVNGVVTQNSSAVGLVVTPAPTPTPTPTPSPTPAPAYPGTGSSELSSFLDTTGGSTGAPGGQAIFYRATDQAIHRIYSNTTWLTDNPAGITGSPAAVSSSSIASSFDVSGATTGTPGQNIFYLAADQHVHHLYSQGANTWFQDDPSQITGATLAIANSPITTFLDAQGKTTGGVPSNGVFYIGTDQHVHHLFNQVAWLTDDPTAGADAPLAATNSSLCSFVDPNGKLTAGIPGQGIFYIGTDQHVHHLYSDTTWHHDDPTATTNAMLAISGSPLYCFLDPAGKLTGGIPGQEIFYIGTDNHVHHIFTDTTWHTDDPTAGSRAPSTATGSTLTGFFDPTGATTGGIASQSLFFLGTDQHVHHIFSDTTWHNDDPSGGAGAQLAAIGSPLSAFLDVSGKTTGGIPSQAIFYIGTDQHIHHLYTTTTWNVDDPTFMTAAPLATF